MDNRKRLFNDQLFLDESKGRFVDLRHIQDDRRILKNPHKGWYWHYVESGFFDAEHTLDVSGRWMEDYHQGYEYFDRDGRYLILDDVTDFPGLNHLYLRFTWGDIEHEMGVYDWTPVDRIINAWSKKGYTFAMRVTTYMGNLFPATPQYVLDMGAKTKDLYLDQMWSKEPVYDDPIYLERLTAFMEAYGKKFNGDPRIEYIDMGTFGTWGEASASTLYSTNVIKKHIFE